MRKLYRLPSPKSKEGADYQKHYISYYTDIEYAQDPPNYWQDGYRLYKVVIDMHHVGCENEYNNFYFSNISLYPLITCFINPNCKRSPTKIIK